MKLLVLGATGDTGKPLLQQALTLGHTVTAVVRDPAKVSEAHPNLTVVAADVFDPSSLQPHCSGQDAVVSVLGFPKEDARMTKFSDSMKSIVEAMRSQGVRRLVTISAWYTDPVSRVGQPMFDNMWAKVPGLIHTLDNEGEMEALLFETCADVDFTSVRVPTLTWDSTTGKDFMVQPAACWVDAGSSFMPREDVARFMLTTLEEPTKYSRKAVAIAIKYTDEEMAEAAGRFKAHMAKYIK